MSFNEIRSLDTFDSSHGGSSESPEIHTLYRVSGSLALLSCIGALFVIITFITIKDLKKHPTRMIFFLSVCDVLFSLKYLVTAVLPHSDSFQTKRFACYLQAGIQQFFGLASIGWSGMISLNLIISTSRPFENPSTYSKFYHAWVWSYSIVTSAILFKNHDVIGPSGDGTCWIKAEDKPLLLMFFIPLLAYFSISISSLIIAAISSRNRSITSTSSGRNNSLSDRNRTGMLLRMSTYTLVFIVCWAGPLAHRISQIAGHHDAPNQASVLMFFDAIGVSIQGFMNALIWITNPSILRGFLGNIMKYLPFSKKFIKDGENTPLIRSLQDESQDPTQLAVMLRNNILTCSLRGITLSVNDNLNLSNSSSLKQQQQQQQQQSHIGGDIHQHLPFDSLSSSSSSNPINHGNSYSGSNEYSNNNNNNNNNNNDNNNNNNINSNNNNNNEQYKVYTEKELFKDIFDMSPDTNMGKHKFKDYCPNIFAKIRSLNNITPSDYLKSFDSSLFFENLSNQKFSEGKSGSFMCFSPDNKFLIKTITRQESVLLKKKINNFYNYLVKNNHSFLLRFYGCHKISMPNDHTIYLAIMSNVFGTIPQGIKIRERYDLKGSKVNRGGNDPLFKGDGLGLDLDFVNYRKFLNLPEGFSQPIIQQLKSDAAFLTSLNIMDYSLLIGVIPNNEDFKKKLMESGANFNNILSASNFNNNNNNNNTIDGSSSSGNHGSNGNSGLLKGSFTNSSLLVSSFDFSNGILSADEKEIYYIGVIDILQLYNFSKKLERFLKVYLFRKDGNGISATRPEPYKQRYMKRMNEIIKNNNYKHKSATQQYNNSIINSNNNYYHNEEEVLFDT
ncbi:hypothetical protein RB653_001421 [Dictyostelium firmibasis]|uniref:Uncharacterized protein n=1 Tax=Dictyostelium firmibasis TaxID=79012 RepID=A0AAN7YRF6_9MYCE